MYVTCQAVTRSFVAMVAFGASLAVSCGEGLVSESVETLPEDREAYAIGIATLREVVHVDLRIGDGPVIGSPDGLCLKDSSVVVADVSVASQLYEYSPSGEFLGLVGARGEGPGRYRGLAVRSIAADREGRLFTYDTATGHLKTFEADGSFGMDWGRKIGITDALAFDVDGHLIQLGKDDMGTAYLKRYKKTLDEEWSLQLTGPSLSVLVWHFATFSGFCTSPVSRRVYYVEPGGYRVREIDLGSGRVRRVFGMRPRGYHELPPRYRVRSTLDPSEAGDLLKATTLLYGGMHFVDGRYLVLGFGGKNSGDEEWLVYDSSDPSVVYALDEGSIRSLAGLRGLRSDDDILYGIEAPADDELDELNGHLIGVRLVLARGSMRPGKADTEEAM